MYFKFNYTGDFHPICKGETQFVSEVVGGLDNIVHILLCNPLILEYLFNRFILIPGNPVSLFVTFLLFARPFILKMQGSDKQLPAPQTAEAAFDWTKPKKRREFARARLEIGDNGKAQVTLFPSHSSGVLSSVVWANGLAVILENQTLKQGDLVQFLSFDELLS